MKRLILICTLFFSLSASAQFPTRDSLRTYLNKWVRNSVIDAFTNLRLNTTLNGFVDLMDTVGIGGSTNNSSVGSGYKLVIPGTRQVKSMTKGWGLLLDSSVSNQVNYKLDSATVFPFLRTNIRKVDSVYSLNDSTIRAVIMGVNKDLTIRFPKFTNGVFDSIRFNPLLNIVDYSAIYAFGNSITYGQNASPIADSSYINRLGAYYKKPVYNYAVGGSGAWKSISEHYSKVNPGHSVMTTAMVGFNDVRRNGSNRKTLNKIINALKTMFVNHHLKSYTAAGTSGGPVNKYGAWTDGYFGTTVGGKIELLGAYTNTVNDSIIYTFDDSTVAIGLIGADGSGGNYSYADFSVYIDNTLIGSYTENNQTDGISDGVYDNKRSPMSLYFTGLTKASHKIKLVNNSSNYLVIEYFGHFVSAKDAKPFVMFHAPKMDDAGYLISPANATNAVIDTLNAKIDSLYNTFPSWTKKYKVRTNLSYVALTTSGLDADHIHPNNKGHRQIFNQAVSDISISDTLKYTDGLVIYSNGNFFGSVDGNLKKLMYQSDVVVAPTGVQGSGTNNVVMKWNGSSNAQNSSITDNGSLITTTTNATINASTSIGKTLQTTSAVGIGTIQNTTIPFISFNKTDAGSNNKIWDFYLNDSQYVARVVNDANSAATPWLEVTRSGQAIKKINLTGQTYHTGTIFQKKDSLPITTSITGNNILVYDTVTYQYKRAPLSSAISIVEDSYTPTNSNNTNVSTLTLTTVYYQRVNNTVTVYGYLNVQPTATGAMSFEITLPVATGATSRAALSGTAVSRGAQQAMAIQLSSGKAKFLADMDITTSQEYAFHFTYYIQ